MLNKSTGPRRVVVTGYGAITALGLNSTENWDSVMEYRLGYRYVDRKSAGIQSCFYGLVEQELNIKFLPAQIRRRIPRFAQLGIVAAKEAVEMAFGDQQPTDIYPSLECGVAIGTGWGGMDETLANHNDYNATGIASLFGCFNSMPNVATAGASQFWNLRGYQNTPIAACATGTIAIGDAFTAIRDGRATMMLAGGAESLLSDFAVWDIDILSALTSEQADITKASCPFSLDRNGFVLSEGAAVLCLEDRDAAIRRGATILGEISGYGNYSDAYDFTSPAQDKIARVATINTALAQAGLSSADIDYINAHGTSTQLNDLNESEAIEMAVGREIPVSSTKGYSGHLIAAAGSFEAIICLKALKHQIMPATCHLTKRDPACHLDYISEGHRPAKIQHTLNLSFGFGGANAAIIISRGIIMLLTFSQEDALKWAAFSGDHNPIHFDAERAKAVGMDSMTVHGMRAMHDMKNHLHNMHFSSVSTGGHYRFSVRLRQSVKYHVPHKILASCDTNNGNVSGQLINTLTDEPCFSATLGSASALPSSKMALMQCISGQEYRALYQQFSSGLNEQNCQWIFEDALLFRCLMQSTDVLRTLADVLPEIKAMTPQEMFEQLPVVQTHHEVHFSDALRHFLAPTAEYSQAFRFDFQPPLVLGDRVNGFIIRLCCQGGFDPENLLTTSITLKTWPAVPSTIS